MLVGLGALGYALTLVYLRPPEVAAAIVNRTIDDQLGDSVTGVRPVYSPAEETWFNQTCANRCTIGPDVGLAFYGTYTFAVHGIQAEPMGISMQFNGTAIYVFFIFALFDGFTNANFTIDGNAPVQIAATSTLHSYQYNALVFSKTHLPNTLHTLNITATSASAYMIFDYAIYTHEDSVSATTSTSQKLSTIQIRVIVGSIAGGVAFVLVISFLFSWRRRGGPAPLVTKFNLGANPSVLSPPGMAYAQSPLSPKASIVIPPSANPTGYNSGYSAQGGTGPSRQNKLFTSLGNPNLPHLSTQEKTREDVRRERQEELDNQLRMVQKNMLELQESSRGPGRSVSLRQRTFGEAAAIQEQGDMSVPDMKEAIRSLKEQVRVLKEQQRSAWAQGLSDDPPPGYTPMGTGTQNSTVLSL